MQLISCVSGTAYMHASQSSATPTGEASGAAACEGGGEGGGNLNSRGGNWHAAHTRRCHLACQRVQSTMILVIVKAGALHPYRIILGHTQL